MHPYIQSPNELPSATVDVDARLSGLRATVGMDTVFVPVKRYLLSQNVSIWKTTIIALLRATKGLRSRGVNY
jgi:hypothetical protein